MVSIVPFSGGADAPRAVQTGVQDALPSRGVGPHHGLGHHHHHHHHHGGPPGLMRGRRHHHHHHGRQERHRMTIGPHGMAKRGRGEHPHGGKGHLGNPHRAHRALMALQSLLEELPQVRGRCGKHHMRMFEDLVPHGHCRRRMHRSLSPHHLMHGRSGEGSPAIGRRGGERGEGESRGGCLSHRRERHHGHHHGQEVFLAPQARPASAQPNALEQGIEQFGQLTITPGSGQ